MVKIANNILAAGLPAVVLLFGGLCLRAWWRERDKWALLAGGALAALYGLLSLVNLAVSSHGRFFGRYTWGPRYSELESLGLVLLAGAFVSLGVHATGRMKISIKKPLLILAGIGALAGLVFFLLETFG